MRLLSTDRAELHYFLSPEEVTDHYAILSHVWDANEWTFQNIEAARMAAKEKGCSPRDIAAPKIKRCCELAERHGYKWVWIDTCCIDKTSSAELSEAINSMFHYYAMADICYAYLRDVADTVPPKGRHQHEQFYRSEWHTRGWTLQELIAPRFLVFLTRDWELIGSKAGLAMQLEEITHVPYSVLTLQEDFRHVSIAERMSWAAGRRTTKEEDRAYSLLGIFNIVMPTIYGEGKRAFQRLQEEIMKHYTDTTLFAWTGYQDTHSGISRALTSFHLGDHTHHEGSYLLAPSPDSFASSGFLSSTLVSHKGFPRIRS
jgi:hypothetical protein